MRSLPEIARDVESIRARHAASLAKAIAGDATKADLNDLAVTDAELLRFDDMCRRTRTHSLMGAGLRWDDELRHPDANGDVARVRLEDRVLFRGVEITISDATGHLVEGIGTGPSMADWTGPAGFRLGAAFRLEHPARIVQEDEAQTSLF